MKKLLDDKVIVIAGCSGGIGSAVFRKLLLLNAQVIGISRTENIHLKNFAKQNNVEYNWIKSDLSSASGWESAIQYIKDRFGKVDALINCVGILAPGKIEYLTIDQIDRVISTNFNSLIYSSKVIIPVMKQQGYGHIINIGSLGGIVPMPYETLYSATKFAARGFSLSLANELKGYGIKVSLISPGPVLTKMLAMESVDPDSTIAFVNRPLRADIIADKIIQTIFHPRTEAVLPAAAKPAAFLLSLFPQLFHLILPALNLIGSWNRRKYSKTMNCLINEDDYENSIN